jgi:hypothetical protein
MLILVIIVLVVACLAAGIFTNGRPSVPVSPPVPVPNPKALSDARLAELMQTLRVMVFHDEAKMDRLIEFEREELKRKGRPEEPLEHLIERAIARLRVDNDLAASLYWKVCNETRRSTRAR